MPVTEFAVIKLKSGYDPQEFDASMGECIKLQNSWVSTHQPHIIQPGQDVSDFWVDDSVDPGPLIITATWDSRESHEEWYPSEENTQCGYKLDPFADADAPDVAVVSHLRPATGEAQLRDAALGKALHVLRLFVGSDKKEELRKAYLGLLAESPNGVWAGWKIEEEDREQLIIFSNDTFPGDKLKVLQGLAEDVITHHIVQIADD